MMSSTIVAVLLWTAAVGSGLMAGIYFTFSGFIMQAFGKNHTTQSYDHLGSLKNKPFVHQ